MSRSRGRHVAVAPPGRLRRDVVLVAAGQVGAVLSAFLFTVVGARLLTPAGFGALSWALSWLAFLAVLGQWGLTQVATVTLARQDGGDATTVVRRLLLAQGAGVGAVALLWWLGIGPLAAAAGTPTGVYAPLVALVALWLPAAAVGPVVVNALRARGRFGWALVFGEHVRRLLLVGLIAGTASTGIPLATVLWWAVAAESAVNGAAVLVLLRVAGTDPGGSGPVASPWSLLRLGSAFTVATLTSAAVPQAGVWLLAVFAPVAEVAVLSVAVRVALLLLAPAAIGMRTLAPRIAAAHERGRLPALEGTIRRFTLWTTAVTAAGVLALAATGRWLLPAVFGEGYGAALGPTLIISAGALVNAWTGPCSVLLSHAGHQRTVALSSALAALAFFGLSVCLAPFWGASGVATAAAVAMCTRNLRLARTARRALGVTTVPELPRRAR
ncbi:lipopolysaccharide biosynthesis protein [Blastococcus sp. SYSU DS0533]